LLTDDNASDFVPKERHLRHKLAIERIRIDERISVVCEAGESHPIVSLLKASVGSDGGNLAVDVRGERMYVVASEKGKVLFANKFAVGSDEDVMYFILAVCEHVGFEVSQTVVIAMSEVPEMVRKYFEIKR